MSNLHQRGDEDPYTAKIIEKRRRWDSYFMDLAIRSSQMSHCERLKVGATAVRDHHPIISSWNGTSPGEDNCCEERDYLPAISLNYIEPSEVDARYPFKDEKGNRYALVTKLSVNHAERNLIEWAAKMGISLNGCILYITHAPCIECAKSIRNAGIVEIVYKDIYRSAAGLNHLKGLNVRELWS